MTEQEPDQVDDSTEPAQDDVADAVDDRASELTGSAGAAQTDAPVADNRGAVAQAEQHLDDANLDSDRDTLDKIQKGM
jgi:hypothetical protein